MTQRKSSAGGSGKKPESDIEKEKRQGAREGRQEARQGAREAGTRRRTVSQVAEAARKRAADERAKQAALENDPVYQEKKRKEAERFRGARQARDGKGSASARNVVPPPRPAPRQR